MYDIFYIGETTKEFRKLKDSFPMVRRAHSFNEARDAALTDMLWIVWDSVEVDQNFLFDYRVSEWDKKYVHCFKNEGEEYNGVCLISKTLVVSSREIDYKFFVNKKEIDIVASRPRRYDAFLIDTYEEYLHALEKSSTELFWMSSRNLSVDKDFYFDFLFPRDSVYDKSYNHAFIHRVGDKDSYNGIFLCSKNKPLSKREVEYRNFIECKEWNIIASGPVEYDKFVIDTYEDYLTAVKKSQTELFWMIPKEVKINPDFKFTLYFPHTDIFNRNIHHSFKHKFRDEYNYNGISLLTKSKIVSNNEIKYRQLLEVKHYDEVASEQLPYDLIFISYNELNADENYTRLLSVRPDAKRVHGVKGLHNAHIEAAKLSDTSMFWVVDGDALILENFKFDYQVTPWDKETVHVWRSKNPINNLEYGYGGVKLLPRQLTLKMDVTSADMTTSISNSFKIMDSASNVTAFNTDAYSTWKSAFRECVKLASKTIDRQLDEETKQRLDTWCTQGADKLFGEFAIAGALAGKLFAETHPTEMHKINDFDWLYQQFQLQTFR
jgi:hypothetical protein